MAVAKPNFTRIFGSAKTDLTPISDSNYVQGWDFVGGTPPTKNDFTYLQSLSDQRTIWLFENYGTGRLVSNPIKFTTAGTYTPSALARIVKVTICGGGGAGGSTPANASAVATVCSGGAGGSYVEAFFLASSLPSSVAITVGAGGNAVATTAGGAGGQSTFGNYIICPGGNGGPVNQQANSSTLVVSAQGPRGNAPNISSALQIIKSTQGMPGASGLLVNGNGVSGMGGFSLMGMGGGNTSGGSGTPGSGNGGGGGGAFGGNSSAAFLGGAGSDGVVIIEEYS